MTRILVLMMFLGTSTYLSSQTYVANYDDYDDTDYVTERSDYGDYYSRLNRSERRRVNRYRNQLSDYRYSALRDGYISRREARYIRDLEYKISQIYSPYIGRSTYRRSNRNYTYRPTRRVSSRVYRGCRY